MKATLRPPPRSRARKSTNKKEQLSRGGGGEIWGRWVPLARAARARRASSTACAIGGSPRRRRRHCAIVPAVRAARRRTGRRGAPLATCRHARIAAPDGPARRHLIRSRYIKKTCKEIFVRTCRRKFKSYLESASRIARSTKIGDAAHRHESDGGGTRTPCVSQFKVARRTSP